MAVRRSAGAGPARLVFVSLASTIDDACCMQLKRRGGRGRADGVNVMCLGDLQDRAVVFQPSFGEGCCSVGAAIVEASPALFLVPPHNQVFAKYLLRMRAGGIGIG